MGAALPVSREYPAPSSATADNCSTKSSMAVMCGSAGKIPLPSGTCVRPGLGAPCRELGAVPVAATAHHLASSLARFVHFGVGKGNCSSRQAEQANAALCLTAQGGECVNCCAHVGVGHVGRGEWFAWRLPPTPGGLVD